MALKSRRRCLENWGFYLELRRALITIEGCLKCWLLDRFRSCKIRRLKLRSECVCWLKLWKSLLLSKIRSYRWWLPRRSWFLLETRNRILLPGWSIRLYFFVFFLLFLLYLLQLSFQVLGVVIFATFVDIKMGGRTLPTRLWLISRHANNVCDSNHFHAVFFVIVIYENILEYYIIDWFY